MSVRLTCTRCGAGLVPTWSGVRCPRLAACGRGGIEESGVLLHPFAAHVAVPSGVRA